jgi:hypothetical protein
MRYIAIVHFDPAILNNLPLAARQDVDRQTMALNREMSEAGILVHAEAIQEGHTARLVRVRNGRTLVTDGPYIETKEQMAGFVLFEARDLNEAIAWQDRDPLAGIGTIELRPIYEIPTPP